LSLAAFLPFQQIISLRISQDGCYLLALVRPPTHPLLKVISKLILIRYNAKLAARPLLTQSVTTAVLFATGDITAQQLVDKRGLKDHDLKRTGRMALYGGCTLIPSHRESY
jgi:hypothetical protein